MKQKNKGAFTIVELIIYMGILSILLTVMTDIFSSIIDVRRESEAITVVEQDGNFLLAKLFYDISHAESIGTPVALGDTTNTLQLMINGVSNTYSLNNGNLQVVNTNGTNILNSVNSEVSDITFFRVGNASGKNTLRLTFTVTSRITQNSGPEVRSYQTSVGLR